MSTNSAAKRDARRDFFPGRPQPKDYRYGDLYYRGCYDLEWQHLEAKEEALMKAEMKQPKLEERVATLEEQVADLIIELREKL